MDKAARRGESERRMTLRQKCNLITWSKLLIRPIRMSKLWHIIWKSQLLTMYRPKLT